MGTINENWRYPRFFTENMTLSPDDARHAKTVLRLKVGDKVILCENGIDYVCSYVGDDVYDTIESAPNQSEPSIHVRLFQCLPKSDKMDFIVQKAVELGVSEIIPIASKRVCSLPKQPMNKITRWNKIAYEAAKQCGRGRVPIVREIVDFKQAVASVKSDYSGIIFYECGGQRLKEIAFNSNADVFIGCEGGFEHEEIMLAQSHGIIPVTLGKRILRVDTASVVALSLLMNLTENL